MVSIEYGGINMVAAKRIDGPVDSTKPTVLVVEDVPAVRMLLAKLLRDSGFQVIEASNGEEAIRVVEAGRSVRLVLSDVHMPGARIDGLDLARWLHGHLPGLKVILASRVISKLEAADARFHEGPILQKPFNPEELVHRLWSALSDRATGVVADSSG
jgi:two-component system, response regulator PdtaR